MPRTPGLLAVSTTRAAERWFWWIGRWVKLEAVLVVARDPNCQGHAVLLDWVDEIVKRLEDSRDNAIWFWILVDSRVLGGEQELGGCG